MLQDVLPVLQNPPGGPALQKGSQTLAWNTHSHLVLSLCSCTALEQLQLEAGINLLLTQPISNKIKKITAALVGQTNCPSHLIPCTQRGFKELIGRVAWCKVSGVGEHMQLNFIGSKPFTCR